MRGSQLIINTLREILNREKIYPCTFLALFLLTPATRVAIPLARRWGQQKHVVTLDSS
jgi:hypothetical protein